MSLLSFFKTASRDWKRVGAITPSSEWTIGRIVERLPSPCRVIVEYGAGDGVITRELLTRLPPDGKLVAFETNEEFASALGSITDPRLVVERDAGGAAETLARLGLTADAVVSGIPFSLMPEASRDRFVQMTRGILRDGGVFLLYQTSPLMVPYLKKAFDVDTALEPRNLPPYFIMRGVKR
jgi:phospholipid N-methyltransferase